MPLSVAFLHECASVDQECADETDGASYKSATQVLVLSPVGHFRLGPRAQSFLENHSQLGDLMSTLISLVDRSYQLLEQLGEGGMGAVFRAIQLVNKQPVALKLVAAHVARDGNSTPPSYAEAGFETRMALAREFQTLASLHHPNVIRVQSYGFDDRRGSYFTMELLERASSILKTDFSGVTEKVLLVAQVLRALSYIHRRGVIHRDIKPGNILVVRGEVKLLDFGIAAQQAEHSELAGTLQYMAPELLHGASPSIQSDLYAVGLILHQLLTGSIPTTKEAASDGASGVHDTDAAAPLASADLAPASALETGSAFSLAEEKFSLTKALDSFSLDSSLSGETSEEELVLGVTGPLAEVVGKLLRRRPEERYQDADSVLRDLSAAIGVDIPNETTETRESFLRATVLVGREAELAELRERLQQSKQGRGGAMLVGGESGVGKSRILSELRTLALVHGFWVAEGQSVTEGGSYYQEWLQLLRSLCLRVEVSDSEAAVLKPMLSDIEELLFRRVADPPPIKPEEVQTRLLSTLRSLLGKLSKPCLIILEDLHWARSESLAMLKELTQELGQLPILIVGTYRTDESPQLPAQLPSMSTMLLNRLGRTQIASLSESMLGTSGLQPELVHYLERQTEGNVFFLIEVVRALAENAGELRRIGEGELPELLLTEGIGRIVARRVERVPVSYRPLLQFAALFGRKLDLAVVSHAFPNLPLRSVLIQCANLAVLESQGTDWRFAHDKLRDGILRQIPAEQRASLHRQVAESIEAVYSAEERTKHSSLLAYHFAQAGLPERALAYYLQAAADATRLCLYAEARTCLSGAQTVLSQLEDTADRRRLRVDLLLQQIQTSLLTDKLDQQIERTNAAQQLLTSLTGPAGPEREDRLRSARLHYYLGRAYHYAGQPGEAIKRYQLVLPVAQEFEDQELLVLPAYVTGIALCMQGSNAKGSALLGKAVGPMERLGNAFDWLRGVLFYGLTLAASGRYREGLAEMNRAFVHAQRIGQPSVLAMCQLMFSALYRTAADWSATVDAAQKTVEHATQSGDKVYLFAGGSCLAWAESYLGQHQRADEHRNQALAIAREMGGRMIISDWFDAADGERAILAGQPEMALVRARAQVEQSRAAGLLLSHGVAARACGTAVARMGGAPAEFDAHFHESLEVLGRGDNLLDMAQTEQWWGRVYLERGEREAARKHLLLANEQYQSSGLHVAMAEVAQLLLSI